MSVSIISACRFHIQLHLITQTSLRHIFPISCRTNVADEVLSTSNFYTFKYYHHISRVASQASLILLCSTVNRQAKGKGIPLRNSWIAFGRQKLRGVEMEIPQYDRGSLGCPIRMMLDRISGLLKKEDSVLGSWIAKRLAHIAEILSYLESKIWGTHFTPMGVDNPIIEHQEDHMPNSSQVSTPNPRRPQVLAVAVNHIHRQPQAPRQRTYPLAACPNPPVLILSNSPVRPVLISSISPVRPSHFVNQQFAPPISPISPVPTTASTSEAEMTLLVNPAQAAAKLTRSHLLKAVLAPCPKRGANGPYIASLSLIPVLKIQGSGATSKIQP
ncbi:hypothetical protein VP01_1928g1 [Puccinia sorghi]|uniref:Uncharacterized protein n=1 Tax=Puccinia sorghi TaxID=27349 RepID=A0A0L6VCI3_9BASI|nr:hypothetical protein VP01_1928g1 [Puccinia sorghi]